MNQPRRILRTGNGGTRIVIIQIAHDSGNTAQATGFPVRRARCRNGYDRDGALVERGGDFTEMLPHDSSGASLRTRIVLHQVDRNGARIGRVAVAGDRTAVHQLTCDTADIGVSGTDIPLFQRAVGSTRIAGTRHRRRIDDIRHGAIGRTDDTADNDELADRSRRNIAAVLTV